MKRPKTFIQTGVILSSMTVRQSMVDYLINGLSTWKTKWEQNVAAEAAKWMKTSMQNTEYLFNNTKSNVTSVFSMGVLTVLNILKIFSYFHLCVYV